MKIFVHRDSVSCSAVRSCAGCGSRAARPFREDSRTGQDTALETLRGRVAAWRSGEWQCGECSERLAPPC
jgi:hypothetical protein